MSDLRPKGVEVNLGERKYRFVLTLNAIDQIQEKCNLPLFDAMAYVAKAADGKMDHDTIQNFKSIVAILINEDSEEEVTDKDVGKILNLQNFRQIAWKVLETYGVHMPEADEDTEEDEHPNAETGQ